MICAFTGAFALVARSTRILFLSAQRDSSEPLLSPQVSSLALKISLPSPFTLISSPVFGIEITKYCLGSVLIDSTIFAP